MNQRQNNIQQDAASHTKSESGETDSPFNPPKVANDQSENNPDKNEQPTESKEEGGNIKETDEIMQGKKLEKEVRGGDATDPDQLEK